MQVDSVKATHLGKPKKFPKNRAARCLETLCLSRLTNN